MGLALLGEPLPAEQAAAWGLIWRVVDDERLQAEAVALARQLATQPTRGFGLIKRALERLGRQHFGRAARSPARPAAGGRPHRGLSGGGRAFLEKRPACFGAADDRARQRPFRSASSAPARWAPASPRSPRSAATRCSSTTRISGAVERARSSASRRPSPARSPGRIDRSQRGATVRPDHRRADASTACRAAGLVIEAIVEDLAAKQELFASSRSCSTPERILATNTSSLSITALAAGPATSRAAWSGMHFFNPAPLMPLVEVVRGLATDRRRRGHRAAIGEAWGKTAGRSRARRRASSSTGWRDRSTARRCARWPSGARRRRDDRCHPARGRRLPHGALRADGPDRRSTSIWRSPASV